MAISKGIYKQTNEKVIILGNEGSSYYLIFLNGEEIIVPKDDIEIETPSLSIEILPLDRLKENIFLNFIDKPLNNLLYSYNTNRFTPETHQYKPLIKFFNSLDFLNNRILIADEVGLGKTIEAGMIFKELDMREKLDISLIIVPSSLTLKWKEEFFIRFGETFEIYKTNQFLNLIDEYENYYNSKLFNEKIIISYHTLRNEKVIEKLEKSLFKIDILIMDEAHTMRNSNTSTFESAEILTKISQHIIFLTATPVQNSLNDLFNILSLLDNDYFKDYEYFNKMLKPNPTIHKTISLIRNNYNLEEIQNFITENQNNQYPQTLQKIFNEILRLQDIDNDKRVILIDKLTNSDYLSFIINRTKKKDVGLATPREAKSPIIEITDSEKDYYDSVIEFVKFLNPHIPQGFIAIMPERMASSSMIASLENFKEIRKNGKLFIPNIDDLDENYGNINEAKNLTDEAKKYLDEIISQGELIGDYDSKFLKFEKILKDLKSKKIKQMIVFSFFKKTLNYLEEKLNIMKYSVGKIHGDIPIEDRFKKIKDFKNGKFDILLSSEIGSEGLDMQSCNVVINYDLPWNPMRVEQRIGRIDRIGQKFDKLYIFNLCIKDSIEDKIYNRLYEKLDIFENSIGELEPILGDLEKNLNINEMINLSQKEIDKKIYLQDLALERKKQEIKKHNIELEKFINDEMKENIFLDKSKIDILQTQIKKIFIEFLEKNSIHFIGLKNKTIKISSMGLKKLFHILKNKMSDKNTQNYKNERVILQEINRKNELKISFETNNNDDYEILYLSLNHPIIFMITKDKIKKDLSYSIISHLKYKNCFATIFRIDFANKSSIKTIIFDKNISVIDECDYFEFISKAENRGLKTNIDLKNMGEKAKRLVIQSFEKEKNKKQIEHNRIMENKINSIKDYFDKRIKRTEKLKYEVSQADLMRMRISQIKNLEIQRDEKIVELERKKKLNSKFKILGILEIK